MNKLLKLSFDKLGYDYDFLTEMSREFYNGKYLFQGEADALLKLRDIKAAGQRIAVMPDYDMDGVAAGAVLKAGLSLLGFDVVLYRPDMRRGYGIAKSDIKAVMKAYPDIRTIITCDVGITANEAIAFAKRSGFTVIVTDHHLEASGCRVDADAIMDPSRCDSDAAFDGVCGAYVAYHLMTRYAELTGNAAIISLMLKLDIFAMLGSAGDLMPPLHDTRAVMRSGLADFRSLVEGDIKDFFKCDPAMLPAGYAAPFENLRALQAYFDREGVEASLDDIAVAFTYCPMVNSVRRVGGNDDLDALYDLLHTRRAKYGDALDDGYGPEFFGLCAKLVGLNARRKEETAAAAAAIKSSDQPYAPYIYITDARPGLCGLIATSIERSTNMPCFVVRLSADGKLYSGSGRLPAWVPDGLVDFEGVSMAGHKSAFGINIDADAIDDYYAHLTLSITIEVARIAIEAGAEPPDRTDNRAVVCMRGHAGCGESDFSIVSADDYDVCFEYASEIRKYGPYGEGYEEPEHILKFMRKDIQTYRTMGADGSHMRITLPFNINIVFFGGASSCLEALERLSSPDDVFAVSGRFSLNSFKGATSLQFMANGLLC